VIDRDDDAQDPIPGPASLDGYIAGPDWEYDWIPTDPDIDFVALFEQFDGVTIVSDGVKETIEELRRRPGKDIWLYGGGELFASLLELDCVDTGEPAVVPVVLGGGRPLMPAPAARRKLALTGYRILAFLTDPEPVGAILRCLDLPNTAPRLSPARAPPQAALELEPDPVAPVDPLPADDFDPAPAFDPADPEPLPELDLGQNRGA
jgi:hypothetical protein